MAAFPNPSSDAGLKKLDEHLLTRSYITGYQASKDDITVFAALAKPPTSQYVNASRWYNHIDALLRISGVSAQGSGVIVEGLAPVAEEAAATPPTADSKDAADEEDDDDVDLFGEETEEEKKAAEERAASVKASTKKKESGKSSVLIDIKPWDDETDMKKLEEAVRSIQMEGLFWGASKFVPVGYGIKKLQIMCTIVDDLVSVDTMIEEQLTVEPINEFVQSCDIVAFNKICQEKQHNNIIITFDRFYTFYLSYKAAKDDLTIFGTLATPPSSKYVNLSCWYNHIVALLSTCGVFDELTGVIKRSPRVTEGALTTDSRDVDFGEETEEEKKAAEERAVFVKASTKKKESGKSSVLIDIKPWDDETDMKKLDEAGASKLVPVGYGIKKLQIMCTIVDDLVSVDTMIEEQLTVEPINEYVQSCDIVAFNKI
ncbi:unnamed protein product [Eruca vesicaria subsp. sativa]|uniref:Translation elongation factor EF1B beta/delta subunit guanine nucleotide exchange domain-containing protein n=1 Tax=Eruca vesicaria subsp. sativa TaxID=29727 RepID=A0ABC8M542_ERUVS|nr:unnamed protein product [Eruca vesicaria subsp. sativa]